MAAVPAAPGAKATWELAIIRCLKVSPVASSTKALEAVAVLPCLGRPVDMVDNPTLAAVTSAVAVLHRAAMAAQENPWALAVLQHPAVSATTWAVEV